MDTVKEITQLIKYSPKRQNLLGDIKEDLQARDEYNILPDAPGIIMLCPTRWTVRSGCFQRILDNYTALLEAWRVCLEDKLQPDIKGRIIGCDTQMKLFDFFFGLCFGERIYCHTDYLSKTLQKTCMSAVAGQRCADLTKAVLQDIRNDEAFESFYQIVLLKCNKHYLSQAQFFPEEDVPQLSWKLGQKTLRIRKQPKIITVGFILKALMA